MPTPARQLCALLHDGRVLTDEDRRIPVRDTEQRHMPVPERAAACGDPTAVQVVPQLQVHDDVPMVLLSVFAPRSGVPAGTWTPVDEIAEDASVRACLRSVVDVVAGTVPAPARRAAWFTPTWYDEVEDWLDERLAELGRRRTGPVETVTAWSLSCVVRVPCEPGGPMWLKAACRHFHAEPELTRLVAGLAPEHTPTVVATDPDRGWLLLEDLPGVDYADLDPVPPAGARVGRALATLQVRSVARREELEALGLTLRDLASTGHQFDDVLAHSVELDQLTPAERTAARAMRPRVLAGLAEMGSLGIPDTVVHGDLHNGNVAVDGEAVVLYDWSDAAIAHPFLDLDLFCRRLPDDEQAAARSAYADVWRTAYPEADIERALELSGPVNEVYQMVSYEHIYRAGEDATYWEMRGVVAGTLRSLPELFDVGVAAEGAT